MRKNCIEVLKNEHGQGMAEYGLIIALVAVAVIIAVTLLGSAIAGKFKEVGTEIQNAKPIN